MAAVSDDLSAHVDVKGVQILNAEETVNVFNVRLFFVELVANFQPLECSANPCFELF
jgi:hypothetical protein